MCPRPSRGYPGLFNRRSYDNNPRKQNKARYVVAGVGASAEALISSLKSESRGYRTMIGLVGPGPASFPQDGADLGGWDCRGPSGRPGALCVVLILHQTTLCCRPRQRSGCCRHRSGCLAASSNRSLDRNRPERPDGVVARGGDQGRGAWLGACMHVVPHRPPARDGESPRCPSRGTRQSVGP